MRLTKSQQEELIVWEYFIPKNVKWLPKTDQDLKMFFELSQEGKHKDIYFRPDQPYTYFLALKEGKRWAGIHWQMYEDGVLDGSMPYFVILGGYDKCLKRKWWQFWKPKYAFIHNPPPREVVNQMKKEMFKGHDAEIIENCYQLILHSYKESK